MPQLIEPAQIAKREDLADIMAIVDVRATPFVSRVRKDKGAANSLFQWPVDAYALPNTDGVVDGVDISQYENHAEQRAILKNQVQIKRRTAKVSRLAQEVSVVAGVPSEIAQAGEKKLIELKRDVESTLLADADAQADNGALPYLTCGLGAWISVAGPTLYPVPAAFRPPSAQIVTTATASLTEDTDIQGILQAIFDGTGMNGEYVLFAGSILRRRFTDMTRTVANTNSTATKVRTFEIDAAAGRIENSTTIYQGDYGTIEIESSSFLGLTAAGAPDKDRGYLLDMDKIHLRYNKMPRAEKFPDLGGGERLMVETIFGLQVDNPIGLGKFLPP